MYVCVGSSESDYCNSPSEKGKKEEAIRDATWANVRLTSGIRVCICVASKLGRSAMHRIASHSTRRVPMRRPSPVLSVVVRPAFSVALVTRVGDAGSPIRADASNLTLAHPGQCLSAVEKRRQLVGRAATARACAQAYVQLLSHLGSGCNRVLSRSSYLRYSDDAVAPIHSTPSTRTWTWVSVP